MAGSIVAQAAEIKQRGWGGLITIVCEPDEKVESGYAISLLTRELGFSDKQQVSVNIQSLVGSDSSMTIFSDPLTREASGETIPTLTRRIFNTIYRQFGYEGDGWEIPPFSTDFQFPPPPPPPEAPGLAFAEFIETLTIDLPPLPVNPKLFVLRFPVLDTPIPLEEMPSYYEDLPVEQIMHLTNFFFIFAAVTNAYPGRFQTDNPQGHVVLAVVDLSYMCQSLLSWTTFEYLKDNAIYSPGTYQRASNL